MSKFNPLDFIKNIFNLLKIFTMRKDINWSFLTKIIKNSDLNSEAKIYGHCNINYVTIGRGSYVSINARISHTTIGKFCSIGPNLVCGWGIHPLNGVSTSPVFFSTLKQPGFTFSETDKIEERKPIVIGNDVFIGVNVTILDGVTIGDGAVIGAGAVVSKDIPPYAIAVGCPIKIIKYRFDENTIRELLELKWWDKDDVYLKKMSSVFFDVKGIINGFD